jgi:hypothetical protein
MDTQQDDTWYFDENVQGAGKRPDYLETKYKTVAAQAKAYKEARQALGGLSGAPDAYSYDNFAEHLQVDNPAIKNFESYAKANKINQDAYNEILRTIYDYEQSQIPDLKDELSRLEGGEQRYNTVETWAKNNLSASAYETFSIIPKTAQTISFFDELRQKEALARQTGGYGLDKQVEKPLTVEDVKSELRANYRKYNDDPAYRKVIENKMRLAAGD